MYPIQMNSLPIVLTNHPNHYKVVPMNLNHMNLHLNHYFDFHHSLQPPINKKNVVKIHLQKKEIYKKKKITCKQVDKSIIRPSLSGHQSKSSSIKGIATCTSLLKLKPSIVNVLYKHLVKKKLLNYYSI